MGPQGQHSALSHNTLTYRMISHESGLVLNFAFECTSNNYLQDNTRVIKKPPQLKILKSGSIPNKRLGKRHQRWQTFLLQNVKQIPKDEQHTRRHEEPGLCLFSFCRDGSPSPRNFSESYKLFVSRSNLFRLTLILLCWLFFFHFWSFWHFKRINDWQRMGWSSRGLIRLNSFICASLLLRCWPPATLDLNFLSYFRFLKKSLI